MNKLAISQTAIFLEEHLTRQIQHPTHYESQADMINLTRHSHTSNLSS